MPTDIVMPQLGESIAEGTLVKWLISQGGAVERDQPLLEVETDKVALEIPSPATGVLTEIFVHAGEIVPVGTLLARLDAEPAAGVVSRVGGVVVRPMEAASEQEQHFSPAVRQLAREHAVELAKLAGTGEGGRVTKKDVLDAVAKRDALVGDQQVSAEAQSPHPSVVTPHEEIAPLTHMRKTIAERMVLSRRTAAHVTTFFEADFSNVTRFREGRSLTYLPFVVHSVCRAMKDYPILNSSWGEQGIAIKKDIHLGIAVSLEEGLLVPVIRHADRKGLNQLAREMADVAERARTKRLSPEEVQEGTFTITNHGGFGSLFSTPIINQPQTAILGVGSVHKRAVVISDAIAIRSMCYLSLSFDHRVIDGATADRFMSKMKIYLEQDDWEKCL